MLRGCDISYAQGYDVDISPYDFVIVRSNDGTDKDEKMDRHAKKVLDAGKLLGFYLFSYPHLNTAKAEAAAMLEYVRPYLGKCILALDWEAKAVDYPTSYIMEFLDYIRNETGIRPFFYTFASALRTHDYSQVAKRYPLWTAHWETDTPETGDWSKWTLWQYQGDPFDLDYFAGTKQDWQNWCGKYEGGKWISKNGWLTNPEMENNAELGWTFFQSKGWTLQSVCGMLGNMEYESNINPGIWGNLSPWGDPDGKGYGLVQWTPYTRITEWMTSHGYKIDDGNGQCQKIHEEMLANAWIVTDKYPMTFQEFAKSTADPAELAWVFLYNYERPANFNQPKRAEAALKWWRYFKGAPKFSPRLNETGIEGNPYWYENNPFYTAGFGLPNCTCYVWGRWWEITGSRPDKLPTGDANTFYERAQNNGLKVGDTPELGAILVTWYSIGGHVAVVEEIHDDGTIVTSNSAWGGAFFYTQTLKPPYVYPGAPSEAYVQGFIYLETTPWGPPWTPLPDPDETPPPSPLPQPPSQTSSLMFHLKLF